MAQKRLKIKKRKRVRTADTVLCYDFNNSPVLLTHPNINNAETFQGYLTGNWSTIQISRTEFEIVDIDARLVLPPMDIKLPKMRAMTRVSPGSISLSLGDFDVPKNLQEIFTNPNKGYIDIRSRMYRAVFAVQADFSFAYVTDYLNFEPADLLLLTIGSVEKGGSLISSTIGRVVTGFLNGLVLSSSGKRGEPKKKAKCPAVHPKMGYRCVKPNKHGGKHLVKEPKRISW